MTDTKLDTIVNALLEDQSNDADIAGAAVLAALDADPPVSSLGLACTGCGGRGIRKNVASAQTGKQPFDDCPRCKAKTRKLPGVGYTDPDLNVWWCVYFEDAGADYEIPCRMAQEAGEKEHRACGWRVLVGGDQ